MSTPLITVAMPVFNAGEYLKPALLSIINQTYSNWELIIIDDGSTDGCFDNLPELNDSRIKVIRDGENKGIAIRLNQAIDLASGEFFARMDSDDISLPERFKMQVEMLEADLTLDLVATRTLIINSKSKIVGKLPSALTHQQICAKPWRGFYMPHPTWLGRIEWFKKHRYASPAPYLCEDQELLLRAYKVSQFKCLAQVLLHYRVKGKINFVKSVNTRWAVLKCQLKVFKYDGLVFNFLAIIVFILRVLKDIFVKLTESKR